MMQTPTAKAPNPKFSSVAVEPNAKKTPKVREDGTTYRWTEEEHSRFLEALALHGFDLTKIAQHIETRDSNQCKSHAQKYFDKPENAAAIGLPRVFVQFRKMRYLFGSSFSA